MPPSAPIKAIQAYRRREWLVWQINSAGCMFCGGAIALMAQALIREGVGYSAPPVAIALMILMLAALALAYAVVWWAGNALQKETGFSSLSALLDAEGGDGE